MNRDEIEVLIENGELESNLRRSLNNKLYSRYDATIVDDVIHDALERIIKFSPNAKFDTKGKFFSWAVSLTYNRYIDILRRRTRTNKLLVISKDDENFFETAQEEEFDYFAGNAEKLRVAIRKLPEAQQQIISDIIYKGMKYKEVSEDTGVSINTALSRMKYALKNLRKIMKKDV